MAKSQPPSTPTTAQSLSALLKSARDIMRNDMLKFPPISQHGNVNEIMGKFGGADQLRNAVNQLQSLLYAA